MAAPRYAKELELRDVGPLPFAGKASQRLDVAEMAGQFARNAAVDAGERQARSIKDLHVGRRQELPALTVLGLQHRNCAVAIERQ